MIFFVTGPTATGKTALAINLAKQYNGELVNCDSRQIYKGLDIVSGKDLGLTTGVFHFSRNVDQMSIGYYTIKNHPSIRIWLYDVVELERPFSAYEYRLVSENVIVDILKREKTPIIVGGTYFYMQSLLYGTIDSNGKPDWELRKKLSILTTEELQKMLKSLNPTLFENLNNSEQNNPQRLIRKIEREQSNSSEKSKQKTFAQLYPTEEITVLGIRYSHKDTMRERVNRRVEERITKGAIKEIHSLLKKGVRKTAPGLQAIGCRQIMSYLKGEGSLQEMKDQWGLKEIQYSKRQLTFMNNNDQIVWKDLQS